VGLLSSSLARERTRAAVYVATLTGLNFLLIRELFFVEFTNNMQTNAGAFMAISRFLLRYWPHVGWFPWWFNGEPIENSYSPLLNFANAGVAWITGASVGRVYNFVTALLYVLGPVFLFIFAWRVSRRMETSFFAALLYSLFSPALLLGGFRIDGLWIPWRLRTLVYYGEGPHNAVVACLPLVLLLLERALTTRRYSWSVAAGAAAALLTLTNTFGATDLAIASVCLIAIFPPKQMPRAVLLVCVIGAAAYIWASPLMPPSLVGTIERDSQMVEGDYNLARMLPAQILIAMGFVCLWFATLGRIRDPFTRFCWLFAYVMGAITTCSVSFRISVLPQPHRYALEMELAVALAVAFTLREVLAGLSFRIPVAVQAAAGLLCGALVLHQMNSYRAFSREYIQSFDVTETVEYRAATWLATEMPGQRVFVGGETATWLDVFGDIPQMHAGHEPANPNWVEQAAAWALYSDQNAGDRSAEVSILWLKAFGCQAILVGPSRHYGEIFSHPAKFDAILPVLWQAERFTLYGVPQRTTSLSHVVPTAAIVTHPPINSLDTEEVARYVAALDDPASPPAELAWRDPSHGRIEAVVRPGELISVQTTYDRGWLAFANGQPVKITGDGIGLMVLHPGCDGPCTVDLEFGAGVERKACLILSGSVTLLTPLLGWFLLRRRKAAPANVTDSTVGQWEETRSRRRGW
jgi:hypothetical protein